ncbi:MAG: HAMP domain-containing sensor histidine kinase [Anaerolineales bacterium]
MTTLDFLRRLRPLWVQRIANLTARGATVRETFIQELERFFNLLEQAIESGDPAWMDGVLYDWASSPPSAAVSEKRYVLPLLLNQMLQTLVDLARETLKEREALDVLTVALPIFTYSIEKATRFEMETRLNRAMKELSAVQEELERLERSKSNFISVAAHELKTPLTLIEGYTAMLRDTVENLTPQATHFLEGIYSGIRRLRQIVDDMIDVSLIDNNMLKLNLQPVQLKTLFGLLKAELDATFAERKQTFEIRPFDGLNEWLLGDPERLYQAFRNVLLNAIKYTPDGGKITVDGRLLPGFVEVTIADTGIGIAPEDQMLIFEKFTALGSAQLHSSGKTKFKGGGPGLGLPITRGIVEAHGGTIWVVSDGYDEEKCPGATFHILLPLQAESAEPKMAKLLKSQSEQGKN